MSEMSAIEQSAVIGGNLAYDIGRVIRFLVIAETDTNGMAGCGAGVGNAVVDWIINSQK
jgi:hypothetical protein